MDRSAAVVAVCIGLTAAAAQAGTVSAGPDIATQLNSDGTTITPAVVKVTATVSADLKGYPIRWSVRSGSASLVNTNSLTVTAKLPKTGETRLKVDVLSKDGKTVLASDQDKIQVAAAPAVVIDCPPGLRAPFPTGPSSPGCLSVDATKWVGLSGTSGSRVTYVWEPIDSFAGFAINPLQGSQTTLCFPSPGAYYAGLTVDVVGPGTTHIVRRCRFRIDVPDLPDPRTQLRLQEDPITVKLSGEAVSPLTKLLSLHSVSGYPIQYALSLHFTRQAGTQHEFDVIVKGDLAPHGSVDLVPVGSQEVGEVTYDLDAHYDLVRVLSSTSNEVAPKQ